LFYLAALHHNRDQQMSMNVQEAYCFTACLEELKLDVNLKVAFRR
jgi:hypothetical protein